MPKAMESLVSSGITDVVSSRSNSLALALGSHSKQTYNTPQGAAHTDLVKLCQLQQGIIADLAEVIHTNAYIKASIQDMSIAVLDGSCKPTNSPAAGTIVNATSNT